MIRWTFIIYILWMFNECVQHKWLKFCSDFFFFFFLFFFSSSLATWTSDYPAIHITIGPLKNEIISGFPWWAERVRTLSLSLSVCVCMLAPHVMCLCLRGHACTFHRHFEMYSFATVRLETFILRNTGSFALLIVVFAHHNYVVACFWVVASASVRHFLSRG